MGTGGGMGRRQVMNHAPQGGEPGPASPLVVSKEQELASLKEHARSMQQQLEKVMKRIEELEAKAK